jgi:hypothetical protein
MCSMREQPCADGILSSWSVLNLSMHTIKFSISTSGLRNVVNCVMSHLVETGRLARAEHLNLKLLIVCIRNFSMHSLLASLSYLFLKSELRSKPLENTIMRLAFCRCVLPPFFLFHHKGSLVNM